MADRIDITIEGLESVFKNVEQINPSKWKTAAVKQMRADQSTLRGDMRSTAPNKTGVTSRSIKTMTFIHGDNNKLFITASTGPRFDGSRLAWYSHFAEVGTPRQKAKRYIQKAGRKNYDNIQNGMLSILADIIDSANGKK